MFENLLVLFVLVCSQRSYDLMPTYPQKENWEIRAIIVPPKSMGGNLFCILFKAQDDEAKRVFVSCSKPKIEAKRFDGDLTICHL